MKQAIIAMLILTTYDAAAALRPESQWRPGATCWDDNSDYVMFHCGCIMDVGDGETVYAASNQATMLSGGGPFCPTNSDKFDGWACAMGVTQQKITYQTGGTPSTQKVGYLCAPKSKSAEEICACFAPMISGQADETNHRYKNQKLADLRCGSNLAVSYDTGESYMYTKYACGMEKQTSVFWSCFENYYKKSSVACEICPSETGTDGKTYNGRSPNKNTGNITSCYLRGTDTIDNNQGVFEDDSGIYGFADDCYYTK